MMPRVALLYPEVAEMAHYGASRKEMPPLGVLYLATILADAGATVAVSKVTPGGETLDLTAFDVVGFSIPSSATYNLMLHCRQRSLMNEKTRILVGGLHATVFPERTLSDFQAHCVVVGEADESIVDIVNAVDPGDLGRIRGTCFYSDSGVIVRTEPSAPPSDLDSLPLPARHLLPTDDIVVDNRLAGLNLPATHIMLSRGCPFGCRFCANPVHQLRYRSGAAVRRELETLVEVYGVRGFMVTDDNFVLSQSSVLDICASIRDLGLRWSALSRVDSVTPKLLEGLVQAGCVELKFGIESGSQRILDAMGKRVAIDQVRQAVISTSSMGIQVKAFVIHGFPGEDDESTDETIELLDELRSYVSRVSVFRFVPLPGSYVYQNPAEFRMVDNILDLPWEAFHLYDNDTWWWGSTAEHEIVLSSYRRLVDWVEGVWPCA
jgi:anaerobic magnesium-protoporphyrin IX monomethyl ester cyclase